MAKVDKICVPTSVRIPTVACAFVKCAVLPAWKPLGLVMPGCLLEVLFGGILRYVLLAKQEKVVPFNSY